MVLLIIFVTGNISAEVELYGPNRIDRLTNGRQQPVMKKKKYFVLQITDNNEQLKYTTFGGLPVKHTLI